MYTQFHHLEWACIRKLSTYKRYVSWNWEYCNNEYTETQHICTIMYTETGHYELPCILRLLLRVIMYTSTHPFITCILNSASRTSMYTKTQHFKTICILKLSRDSSCILIMYTHHVYWNSSHLMTVYIKTKPPTCIPETQHEYFDGKRWREDHLYVYPDTHTYTRANYVYTNPSRPKIHIYTLNTVCMYVCMIYYGSKMSIHERKQDEVYMSPPCIHEPLCLCILEPMCTRM